MLARRQRRRVPTLHPQVSGVHFTFIFVNEENVLQPPNNLQPFPPFNHDTAHEYGNAIRI